MQQFLFNLGKQVRKPSPIEKVRDQIREDVWLRHMDSPFGYLFFLAVAFMVAFMIGTGGVRVATTVLGLVFAIPALLGALFHLRFGIYLILISGFFLLGIKRMMPETPVGLFVDLTVLTLLFGLLNKQIRERDWRFLFNPLSLAVLIWIGYSTFQILNPYPNSLLPWLYTIRHIAGQMLLYFVALYAFREISHIRLLAKIWIALATLGAIYGLWQEFYGLTAFEYQWLMGDPQRFELFYTWNRIRVFSFFSDPTVFGIMMGFTSLFSGVFLLDPYVSRPKKVLLGIAIALMLAAMVYSGTRTAFIMIPAGIFFYALLSAKKWVLIGAGSVFVLGIAFITMPIDNMHIKRLQSAFDPAKSASFQVRIQNQEYIQPFIRSHPMGSGMGTTGIWGARFASDTMLSQFPPDSGFVRIAVEMGWVGLLFYCGLMFVILWEGVVRYFRTQSPYIRTYYQAFLVLIFALIIANYPQQAITQLPNSLMFFISMAVIIRLKEFDWETDQTIEEDNVTV